MVLTDSVSRQSDDIRKITTDTARIPILQNEQNIPSQMQPHRDTRKKQTPIFSGGLSLIQAQGKKTVLNGKRTKPIRTSVSVSNSQHA